MRQDHDDDESDLDDFEEPDESDRDDGDESDTIPCPFCKKDIYEYADVCPHCGNFITATNHSARLPRWAYLAALACLVAGVLYAVMSLFR